MTQTAKLLVDIQCALGEGPVWHGERQQLFWVDINNRQLFAASADGKVQQSWTFDETMAAIAIVDRDTLVLVGETGLKRLDLHSGAVEHIFDVERHVPTNRGNDSRVHPSGAFWIGTMVKDEGPKDGAVYHFRNDKLQRIIADAAIPNATSFTGDGRRAYWTDTPTNRILTCQTDPQTGMPLEEWTLFADTSDLPGHPDGAVVDSEGFLWNARWGGSSVIRFAPDGSVDRIVEVPVSQVTCPAFGGPGLKRLFLTTANKGLSPQQLAEEKVAGGIFFIDLDIAGLPEAKFKL